MLLRSGYERMGKLPSECYYVNVAKGTDIDALLEDIKKQFSNRINYSGNAQEILDSTTSPIPFKNRAIKGFESIEYMEQHLANEIDYGELGKIACCSTYHYQRMFTYMAGIPLSEYIRRRKMSLAAVDLQQSNAKLFSVF